MEESARINDQLKRAYEGTAWHGPSLKELLHGVTGQQAAAKPIPHAHSIWEIVLHISAWEAVAASRIERGVLEDPSNEEDWPAVTDTSEEAWATTLQQVADRHMALREVISRLDDAKLREVLPVRNYSVYFLLHGVVQHDLYHAGQIALLKKCIQA
jgi:uncharacterized damage-inducible protein DinB